MVVFLAAALALAQPAHEAGIVWRAELPDPEPYLVRRLDRYAAFGDRFSWAVGAYHGLTLGTARFADGAFETRLQYPGGCNFLGAGSETWVVHCSPYWSAWEHPFDHLVAIDPRTLTERWRRTSGAHRFYPWLVSPAELLLVETERPIDAHDPDHGLAWLSLVNPTDGKERWRVPLFSDLWLPTAEADGRDLVLHAEKSGRARFFDPATGQERAGRVHADDRPAPSEITVGATNTYACSKTGLVRAIDRVTGALAWYAGFAPFCPPLYVRPADGARPEALLAFDEQRRLVLVDPAHRPAARVTTVRGRLLSDTARAGVRVWVGDVVVRTDARGRFVARLDGRADGSVKVQVDPRDRERYCLDGAPATLTLDGSGWGTIELRSDRRACGCPGRPACEDE